MKQNIPSKSEEDFIKYFSGLELFFTMFFLFLEDNKNFLQVLETATSAETDWSILPPVEEAYF